MKKKEMIIQAFDNGASVEEIPSLLSCSSGYVSEVLIKSKRIKSSYPNRTVVAIKNRMQPNACTIPPSATRLHTLRERCRQDSCDSYQDCCQLVINRLPIRCELQ